MIMKLPHTIALLRTAFAVTAFVALMGGMSSAAYAACTSPAGVEGEMIYNDDNNVMQYCDGTTWIGMAGGSGAGGGGGGLTDGDKGDITVSGSGTVWTVDNPAAASGAQGYVQFAGPSSAFANSGTTAGQQFFWDNTAKRLGLGTATPTEILDVVGNATASSVIYKSLTGAAAPLGGSGLWTAASGNVYRTTGNVGIGTNSPVQKLDVGGIIVSGSAANASFGSTGFGIKYTSVDIANTFGSFYSSAGTVIGFAVQPKTGAAGYVSSAGNASFVRGVINLTDKLVFSTAAAATVAVGSDVTMTDRFVVDSTGKVGIGTSNPLYPLHILGASPVVVLQDSAATAASNTLQSFLSFKDSTGTEYGWVGDGSSTTNAFAMQTNLSGGIKIGVSSNSCSYSSGTSWTCSSDARLKKEISPATDSLVKILKLQGVTYQWKDTTKTGTHYGFIAQDVEKVYPEMVSEDEKGMKAVDYSAFMSPVVEAIKEIKNIIDDHTDTISQLRAENAQLKAQNITILEQNAVILKRLDALEAAQ